MALDHALRRTIEGLRTEARDDLLTRILPCYDAHTIDHEHGGFVGEIDLEGHRVPDAAKGIVLNSRILWTFSRAFRLFGDPQHLDLATRAAEYLHRQFWDAQHGGVFWMLDHRGHPVTATKRTYGQTFALFGFAEHARATGDPASLDRAVAIHRLLERHSAERRTGGYVDERPADWARGRRERWLRRPAGPKSMNSHLHLLEAYTVLLAVWDDPRLRRRQHRLIDVIMSRCYDPALTHFRQDFDAVWTPTSDEISYGHDLESGWLLAEALQQLGDHPDRRRIDDLTLAVARTTLAEAMDDDGGLWYRGDAAGVVDRQKIWWAQAEAAVGFLDAFERSGDQAFLDAAVRVWRFVQEQLSRGPLGEWRSSPEERTTFPEYNVTIGAMKGPYHNGRACMEIIVRAGRMLD